METLYCTPCLAYLVRTCKNESELWEKMPSDAEAIGWGIHQETLMPLCFRHWRKDMDNAKTT